MTDTQYGLKAKASEINDTTNAGGIASAANTCDQTVTLADGSTTERRYTAMDLQTLVQMVMVFWKLFLSYGR